MILDVMMEMFENLRGHSCICSVADGVGGSESVVTFLSVIRDSPSKIKKMIIKQISSVW